MYNSALKRKWDNQNVLDYAVETAVNEARREERAKAELEIREERAKVEAKAEAKSKAEKLATVNALNNMGMPAKDIARAVGLSEKDVEALLFNSNK